MNTIDNKMLVSCIHHCFMLSLDGRLSEAEQKQMNALGKQLRGNLINLLSASFEPDLEEVKEADKKLRSVNKFLADTNQAINKIADTVERVTDLIKTLDKLLLVVTSFV